MVGTLPVAPVQLPIFRNRTYIRFTRLDSSLIKHIDISKIIKTTTNVPNSTTPTSYTATEDCHVVAKYFGNNRTSGYFAIDNVRLSEWNNQSETPMFMIVTYPVKKGQTVTIRSYGSNGDYTVYGTN